MPSILRKEQTDSSFCDSICNNILGDYIPSFCESDNCENKTSSSSGFHLRNQACIAGAVVGSIAGVLLLVVLPGLLWYCRRRRRGRELQEPFEKPQLHADCIPRQELDGTQISELQTLPAESKGTEQRPKLAGIAGTNEQQRG
ncbi:hypothetical protein F4782DRAFT_305492 [Xylaria castorea]|nr:hypothetical protein F4782DRAFT_305492 [Xylaria castorea]